MELSIQEIEEIEKELDFIVNHWHKHLINKIIQQAKSKGIKKLYMNSSESLRAGSINENKKQFFYETLPPIFGFTEVYDNLRNEGQERLWLLDLGGKKVRASSEQELIPLSKIKDKYQKNIQRMFKHDGPYTRKEIEVAIQRLKSREKRRKDQQEHLPENKFTFTRKKFNSIQNFDTNVSEFVVIIKLKEEIIKALTESESEAVKKFLLNFVFGAKSHFSDSVDSIGWVLISPINKETWLINQIQSDIMTNFRKLKRDLQEISINKDNTIDDNELIIRLHANNRSLWQEYLSHNETFMEALKNNAELINSLPDNNQLSDYNSADDFVQKNPNFLDQFLRQGSINQKINKYSFNLKNFMKK